MTAEVEKEQMSSNESSDAEGSDSSYEAPEALAFGREKRQTAGNRLRDMLNAEIESEAIFAEDAEDVDFGSDQDQQDDLDSELDSDSSDDQPVNEAEDAGEHQLQKQEKELARARKRKAAEAFKKAKPVNNAASRKPQVQPKEKATKQKMKHGLITPGIKRQSSRAHAVEIAGAVEKRLTEEADKRSKIAKAARPDDRPLTQAERLEEAKLTEARNVASLNQIVKYEEDKRANQKLQAARRKAIGPFIRFTSTSKTSKDATKEPLIVPKPAKTIEPPSLLHPLDALNTSQGSAKEDLTSTIATPSNQSIAETRQVKHFLSVQNPSNPETPSLDVLQAVFGSRPKALAPPKPKPMCSLSGLPARYKDPETNITYGNQHAYLMLQELKTGTIPWNPQLKMYVPRSTL